MPAHCDSRSIAWKQRPDALQIKHGSLNDRWLLIGEAEPSPLPWSGPSWPGSYFLGGVRLLTRLSGGFGLILTSFSSPASALACRSGAPPSNPGGALSRLASVVG